MNQLGNDHIERLFAVQQEITREQFVIIFGKVGDHLWNKYTTLFGLNLVTFLYNIGRANRADFLLWLNSQVTELEDSGGEHESCK